VTLPTVEVRKGRIYTVKDESGAAASNNITVATQSSETIDGSATDVINLNYESKSYYSDGTNWFILPITPNTNTQNTYEAPGLTLGTSNVEGSGNSIRSGATILAFDATDPSTQAHSDASAAGSATVAARRDHKHAMPAAGGGLGDHGARAYHDANQSISNATATVLSFNQERWDTDAYHDLLTNNSRLTVPSGQDGKYIIAAHASFGSHATGFRRLDLLVNGSTLIFRAQYAPTTDEAGMTATTIYNLSATDYVEMRVYQNSGGSLNIISQANATPEFSMQRVA